MKNKNKNSKYVTEEQKEVKKFILLLGGLILVVVGIYFFTRAFVTKDLFKNNSITYSVGVIDYDSAIVGTMLNRKNDEYYVIAFNSEDVNAVYYNNIANQYMQKDTSLKMYFVDLNDKLNEPFIAKEDEKVSQEFKSLESLKLGEITLLRVKNGKVIAFEIDENSIRKELAI